MKQMHMPRKLMMSGSVAAAIFAVAALPVSAQDATTTTSTMESTSLTTSTSTSSTSTKKTTATEQMIQEACQRQKARTAKFLQFGILEEFGSEEPFTFDPKAPAC
jgi:phage-related minor tail protein